jgi:MFS transporter, FHS family, L-fucose permease
MASIPASSTVNRPEDTSTTLSPSARLVALSAVTALFFMWGFITCLNDILIPHLKAVFQLNYLRSSLIQFTFFGAYFVMSMPAGAIVARLGYKGGVIVGLVTAAAGTLLFLPAASLISYNLFLGALFVLATGITVLQVAANPYVAALGKPEMASSRLNLAQAFNSLGTTLAPYLGGWVILSAVGSAAASDAASQAATVKLPYLGLTFLLLLLAGGIALIKLPHLANVEEASTDHATFREALKMPQLRLGVIGIFLYVGAEVAIGSYLINFMGDPNIAGFERSQAAYYVPYYWGGAMVGRFIGSALTRVMPPHGVLAANATIATALTLIGFSAGGHLAMWAVLAIGLFNSIMFPTIFTLGIANLGHLTGRGSSLLIMAIVGGAIVPVAMGYAADRFGVHHSLFIPALCYLYIIYYGLAGYRPQIAGAAGGPATR